MAPWRGGVLRQDGGLPGPSQRQPAQRNELAGWQAPRGAVLGRSCFSQAQLCFWYVDPLHQCIGVRDIESLILYYHIITATRRPSSSQFGTTGAYGAFNQNFSAGPVSNNYNNNNSFGNTTYAAPPASAMPSRPQSAGPLGRGRLNPGYNRSNAVPTPAPPSYEQVEVIDPNTGNGECSAHFLSCLISALGSYFLASFFFIFLM